MPDLPAGPEGQPENPFAAPTVMEEAAVTSADVNFAELRRAGNGLMLIYFSLMVVVLAAIGGVVMPFMARVLQASSPAFSMLFLGMTAVAILSTVLNLLGKAFCISVPDETRARGLALAAFLLGFVQVFTSLVARFAFLPSASVVGVLGFFASHILFLLYMRRLANHIQRPDLVRRTTRILIGSAIVGLLTAGFFAMTLQGQSTASIVIYGTLGFGLLILFVMYANLVNELGKSIRNPTRASATNHV